MKTHLLHPLLFSSLLLLPSCEKEHMDDCFQGTGSIIFESRDAGNFHSIEVEQKVDVIIRQGSTRSVEVEAGENIISGITTRIVENTLFIANENKCNWVRSYSHPIRVHVTVPQLDAIYQKGNGTVSSGNTLLFDTLNMEIWSSGDIELDLQSSLVLVRQHVSVGDVTLTGNTSHLYVYNNGNGFSRLQNFLAATAQVDARGTGDTHVLVDSLLEYSITGIGNIYLYGGAVALGHTSAAGALIRK